MCDWPCAVPTNRYDAIASTSDVQRVIGLEQAEVYRLDEVTITGILVACVVGVLLASGLILAVQIGAEVNAVATDRAHSYSAPPTHCLAPHCIRESCIT